MGTIDSRMSDLGIALPTPAAPIANYVGAALAGDTLVISGQLALGPDGKLDPGHKGKVGQGVADETAAAAARLCAINVLAQAKAVLGDLDRIERCVRLGGFINSDPAYTNLAAVMNGASDLMVEVLGDKGKHARSTIGVASLPLGCVVEVEALFHVRP